MCMVPFFKLLRGVAQALKACASRRKGLLYIKNSRQAVSGSRSDQNSHGSLRQSCDPHSRATAGYWNAQGVIATLLSGSADLSQLHMLGQSKPQRPLHSRHGSLSSMEEASGMAAAASHAAADGNFGERGSDVGSPSLPNSPAWNSAREGDAHADACKVRIHLCHTAHSGVISS